MSSLDEPIVPTGSVADYQYLGFSKRERACIDLRIPETDDPELNALIEKARRQEFAAKAMQAYMIRTEEFYSERGPDAETAEEALGYADALIAELERNDA